MVRTCFFLGLFVPLSCFAQAFVSPMGFEETEENKQKVIAYIKHQVKQEYAMLDLDIDDPMTLRVMEKENLRAFKRLMQAENAAVLSTVIDTYCGMGGVCDYATLWMMYEAKSNATVDDLEWEDADP